MSRTRRTVRRQSFYADNYVRRSRVPYRHPSVTRKAIAKIEAIKRRKTKKKIEKRLKTERPGLYRNLPDCKSVRERVRRAFFGFIKSRMPLPGAKKRKNHNDRFTIKPCRS